MKNLSILVFDNEEIIFYGIKYLFGKDTRYKDLLTINDARRLTSCIKKLQPDLLIMDIPSPFPEGIKLVKKIRLLFPELKVLIYTRNLETWKIKKILLNGVNGLLDKSSESKKLIYAIEQMVEKGIYFEEGIKEKFFFNHSNKEELPDLTRRERQVLELVLDEKSTKEIALYLHISITTVETYRRNLLFKFDVKNSAGLVKQAYEKGFV